MLKIPVGSISLIVSIAVFKHSNFFEVSSSDPAPKHALAVFKVPNSPSTLYISKIVS